jgi:hypothetical protein
MGEAMREAMREGESVREDQTEGEAMRAMGEGVYERGR